MTGPVSFYALAELNRQSEGDTLKVRSELSRIGASPDSFLVFKQGAYLQLKYRKQIILASPQEILSILHKIQMGSDEAEIWVRICKKIYPSKQHKLASQGSTIAVFFLLLGVAIYLGVFLNI